MFVTAGAGAVRFRAPEESGSWLVAPPAECLAPLARSARTLAAHAAIGEFALADLLVGAREEALARAWQATQDYADPPRPRADGPWVMAGHQPGFVHPGVWLKNFVADAVASAAGGVVVNLVIDGDAARGAAVRSPAGSLTNPRLAQTPFDSPAAALPWEEREVRDPALWESFGQRLAATSRGIVAQPLVEGWWPQVLRRWRAHGKAGAALAEARHQTELSWGVTSLELPQSAMCQLAAFRKFTCAAFSDLPRFHAAYNRAVDAYRRRRGIRNRAHPAPNLATHDGWYEAPWWLWSIADPRRRPLWVKPTASGVELGDREQFRETLTWSGGRLDAAVERLADWERRGIKLRSRAFVTTMFARLALADLFIHGIGGAHYDQVTDELCSETLGVRLPPYATVSGTLRLVDPLPAELREGRPAEWRAKLREWRYHPERFVDAGQLAPAERQVAEQAAAVKQAWIARATPPDRLRERHREIEAANGRLHALLAEQQRRLQAGLERSLRAERGCQVLASREYAFCLFEERRLRAFLTAPA